MTDIVSEKFLEWIAGLDPLESRIRIFQNIRNIPYAVIPELIDHNKGPSGLLFCRKGSCSPKHFLLGEMFRRLGIPVKYASFPFRWSGLDVRYPSGLKEIVAGLPADHHLACKVFVGNRWVLIDATWDLPLRKAGFPVTVDWDGFGDTVLGVVPLEEQLHHTPAERTVYLNSKEAFYTGKEKAEYGKFIEEFNRWLEEIRQG
jgi:transglutaminase-like putative cysteine protease